MDNSTLIFIVFTRKEGGIFHGDSVHLPESQRNDFTSMANSLVFHIPAGFACRLGTLESRGACRNSMGFGLSNGWSIKTNTGSKKAHIHHPSSIIHHPSSIIHHPSSIIHKYPLYRAYIGISHKGTLVGVHPTISWPVCCLKVFGFSSAAGWVNVAFLMASVATPSRALGLQY